MLKQYRLRDYKFSLIILLIALSTIGILIVGSAQESVQNKQFYGLILGLGVMVVVSLMDYVYLLNFYWLAYIGSIILLIMVRLFGTDVNGSRRWIEIGFRFQPSELCKILLILFFSKYLMKHKEDLNTLRTLTITAVLMIIPLILIEMQPDLSTTITVALMFCALLFVAGISYKLVLGTLAVIIPLSIVFISIVIQPNQTLIEDYQQNRILAWLHPEEYSNSVGYQQSNSIMAIGSGQLYGKGLNENTIASVKNGNFISEPQTDFIFAIAGEELGFVGCCVIIILIVLIVINCILIGRNARDFSGTLICSGIGALIGFQSFINIGVATAVLPNTGLTLPFVSYGLTSLVSMYIGIGFVLNVGLQQKKY